jgi:hypothetical protein
MGTRRTRLVPVTFPSLPAQDETAHMDDRSWLAYRIEHHRPPAAPAILGYCHWAERPALTLAPYAARLLDHGETGAVALIHQATEAIVAVRLLIRLPFRS